MVQGIPEPTGLCQKCNARPATERWGGEFGAFALSHTWALQFWCKKCVLEAQVAHAREATERLSDLERQLEELT